MMPALPCKCLLAFSHTARTDFRWAYRWEWVLNLKDFQSKDATIQQHVLKLLYKIRLPRQKKPFLKLKDDFLLISPWKREAR